MKKIKFLVLLFVTCVALSKGTATVTNMTYEKLDTMTTNSNIFMELPDASAFTVGK